MDAKTGALRVNQALAEDDDPATLSVTATDDGTCCSGGDSGKHSSVNVIVRIIRANRPPTFQFCGDYDRTTFDEEQPPNTVVRKVSFAYIVSSCISKQFKK